MVATDLPVVSDRAQAQGFSPLQTGSDLAAGCGRFRSWTPRTRASVHRPDDTPSVDHVTFSLAGGDRGKRAAGWGRVSADRTWALGAGRLRRLRLPRCRRAGPSSEGDRSKLSVCVDAATVREEAQRPPGRPGQ